MLLKKLKGDWHIVESSHMYEKIDSMTVSFNLPVKKNGETKKEYRAWIIS